ncbi:LysR substrate-binding domain-containing protein [Daeguia caeni]|uniref:LysR substrate-binding domain-containing protein n=1 Tax=Daeguia caeni TaxID=439612 RepID=A0ABV9H5D8_9HYPH
MTVSVPHPLPTLDADVLRTFVAIVDTGSFAAAANAVFRTPSAVSMQIKKLEEQLGVSVFDRDARAVTLTSDGEMLLGYARRILALNREAVAKFVAPSFSGLVRLGAPDDVGESLLPLVLKRFSETHPGVMVDVVIDQSVGLRKRFDDGKLDLALVNLSSNMPNRDDFEILLEEELIWVGAKCGTAYRRDPLPLSIWEEGCAWRDNALAALEKAGRNYRVAYMSSHATGRRAAILADLAVAPSCRTLLSDGIVALGPEHDLPPLGKYQLGMTIRRDAASHIKAVADHLREVFETYRRVGRFDLCRAC